MPIVPNLPAYAEPPINQISEKESAEKNSDNDSIGKEKGQTFVLPENPNPSEDSLEKNVFADPEVCAHYTALYEKSKYEGRHVFDPTLEWTDQEERALIRKIDWNAVLWAVSQHRISCVQLKSC